jgi:membrane-associated protease RseP (regulator of RpoE activity)
MLQSLIFLSFLMIGLIAVLFCHELGHLLAARWCGVPVKALSVGFGPRLITYSDRVGTVWSIRAILLGGSCAIFEENYDSQPSTPDFKELFKRSLQRRALICVAGPACNFLVAAAFFCIARLFSDELALFSSEIGSRPVMLIRLIIEFSILIGGFNLLPLLPLDGGRISIVAIEALLGHRVPQSLQRSLMWVSITVIGLASGWSAVALYLL